MWMHGTVDGTVRRKWFYCVAVTSTSIDCGSPTPTTAYGSGTPATAIDWFEAGTANYTQLQQPNMPYYLGDVYAGGMQIETTTTTAYGIVAFGDSKTQYNCGTWDTAGCNSWVSYFSGLMNVPVFNRGTGGQTCSTMTTNYASQVHPIVAAGRAKYVIIYCGTNDIDSNYSTSAIEGYLTTLVGDVVSDGAIPVVTTIGPNSNVVKTPAWEGVREQVNAWIRGNCGLMTGASGPPAGCPYVLDFDKIDRDPLDPMVIRQDPTWQDPVAGIHPLPNAHRREGEYAAQSYQGNTVGAPSIWSFPRPSQYQAALTTTPTQDIAYGDFVGAGTGKFSDAGSSTGGCTSCVNTNQVTSQNYVNQNSTNPASGNAGYISPQQVTAQRAGETFYAPTGGANAWAVGQIAMDSSNGWHLGLCAAQSTAPGLCAGAQDSWYFASLGSSKMSVVPEPGGINSYSITLPNVLATSNTWFLGLTTEVNVASTLDQTATMNYIAPSANLTLTTSGTPKLGARQTVIVCQPATGGPFTVAWPASYRGAPTVTTTASQCTVANFVWESNLGKWFYAGGVASE
jgi:hypothetical protein